MPSYTLATSNNGGPIIHPALRNKLTPVEGGQLSCNDLGVWTLVRRASCPNADADQLIPQRLSADWLGVYTSLFLDTISASEGKAETILTLTYKGARAGGFGGTLATPQTVLQSGQFPLTDAAFNAGTYPDITDKSQPIACSYYSTQISYRWASQTAPAGPTAGSGGGGGNSPVPFNMSPVSAAPTDLAYKSVTQTTNFQSTPEARHFINTATVATILVAKNVTLGSEN